MIYTLVYRSAKSLHLSSSFEEDKVIVFERGELLFVVNLHPGAASFQGT